MVSSLERTDGARPVEQFRMDGEREAHGAASNRIEEERGLDRVSGSLPKMRYDDRYMAESAGTAGAGGVGNKMKCVPTQCLQEEVIVEPEPSATHFPRKEVYPVSGLQTWKRP